MPQSPSAPPHIQARARHPVAVPFAVEGHPDVPRLFRAVRTLILAVLLSAAAAAWLAMSARADTGPRQDLWSVWQAHDPSSTVRVDHNAFDAFLSAYRVMGDDGIARIRYGAVSPTDKAALGAYVARLAATPVSRLNRDEQFAFWINFYNAATIAMIIEHFPLDSILNVPLGGWFSFGPWDAKIVTVEGHPVSLNDMEHRILRPIWNDPRIHYAVNCASIGCPNLADRAYRPDRMDEALTNAARDYVNHPRGVRVRGGKLVVSSIYVWFESDFKTADGSVLAHLKRYAAADLAESIQAAGQIFADDYDWSLNGAP